jgi:hypothetical protein
MESSASIPTKATERRWVGCSASVGVRALSAEYQEKLRAGVRWAFMRAVKPLWWAGGFAVIGVLTLVFRTSLSDTVLGVFVFSEAVAAVFVGVSLMLLCEASRVQHAARPILRHPLVERFEVPPEVALWLERGAEGGDSCDLLIASYEVLVFDGKEVEDVDSPYGLANLLNRRRPTVWVGEWPPALREAGFGAGG